MADQIQVKKRPQPPGFDPKKRKGPRIAAFKEPKPGFFRRVLRFVFHPITVGVCLLAIIGVFLTLTYFWFEYSERVDGLLRGDVFTRSAGVYSAPKTLKVGENITPDGLITYLKSAGYIEKNQQADPQRSRYAWDGNSFLIEPGITGVLDGAQQYQPLTVKFVKGNNSVASIGNSQNQQTMTAAQLEPKILSSITNEENGRRKVISFKDLPPQLIKAMVTTEDRGFFEHYGVNFRGIARAFWRRLDDDDNSPIARQGGSSITQQLVKNLLLTSEKSWTRKATEAYMSVILETRLSKEQIFELYANQIYLGQQAGFSIYGVGEGSNAYFGKDVSALTLPEAAFLAGIIRSPNRYNPYKNLEKATERRNQVLESMMESGQIDQTQLAEAKSTPLQLVQIASRPELLDMPYFTGYAEQQLNSIVSDPDALQHLRVYTTIDVDLQRAAYEAVTKRLDKLDKSFPKRKKGDLQAALIALNPKTGEIKAMIGGRDFLQNQFNRATDAMRQPGSVFKPFVYASAINSAYDFGSRVFTAATIFKDEPKTFTYGNESYSPNNFGDTFSNKEMTLRDALVKSKNVITVDLAMELNIGKVMNFAAKAGFPKVAKAYPSMALGTAEATPLEVATAYTTFANLGQKTSPVAVNRVTGGDGRTVTAPTTQKTEIVRQDVAYIMTDIMKDVVNRGTAADLHAWGFNNVAGKTGIAGKTGTSRDGWFAGFTPNLVCVVYVGFDDGSDLGMKGADSALPIWADFMKEALGQHPEWNGDWTEPGGIRKAEIDIRNGKLIRELTDNEASNIQTVKETEKQLNANKDSNSPLEDVEMPEPEAPKIEDVPVEFRRIELFVGGTVPNKNFGANESLEETPVEELPIPGNESPTPVPEKTPVEKLEMPLEELEKEQSGNKTRQPGRVDTERTIMVQICPTSGLRASPTCPIMVPKKFKAGSEPILYCDPSYHRK
ncbi:MAG TPA: PBP1A family penicillin-binding protein [Pyrinomonadaceae bacterium]|jgi:penicillin-binding protein 1B|nr:PBP1A family penicillin-binding protein [Pyrinomonadaceae bacterium]